MAILNKTTHRMLSDLLSGYRYYGSSGATSFLKNPFTPILKDFLQFVINGSTSELRIPTHLNSDIYSIINNRGATITGNPIKLGRIRVGAF